MGGHLRSLPRPASFRFRPVTRASQSNEVHMIRRASMMAVVCLGLVFGAVGLAARGASPSAFDRRCIPPGGVAQRSNTGGILAFRALPAGRIVGLGATTDLHHGLLA